MVQCRGCAQTEELVIERKVCLYAQHKGHLAFKTKTENRRFFPDRMFLGSDRGIYFIEFKKPKTGILSHGQMRTITKLRALGHDVYVCDRVAYGKEIVAAQANGERPAPVPERGDWVPD